MKLFQHIIIKRVAALSLIATLLLINVLKAFHTHGLIPVQPTASLVIKKGAATDGPTFRKELHCAICEFQLAKDADALMALPALQVPYTWQLQPCAVTASFTPAYPPVVTGRGPPTVQGLI